MKVNMKKFKSDKVYFAQLEEMCDLDANSLYRYCQQGELPIMVEWEVLRKKECNTKCIHTQEYLPVTFPESENELLNPIIPCKRCEYFENKEICQFEYRTNWIHEKSFRVKIFPYQYFFCFPSDVEKFIAKFREDEKNLPACLDPDNEFYSKEIDVMIETWRMIFEDKKNLKLPTAKKTALDYMRSKYGEKTELKYSDTKLKNMASLIDDCFKKTPTEWKKFVEEAGKSNS